MFNYKMSPTGKAFHECDKFLKLLCGPYGSGKSTCCAVDLLAYACAQTPADDGVRYSRVGVVRATYPELISSTRRTLLEVLPEGCGSITNAIAPLKGVYVFPLADGTTVNLELDLVAMRTGADEFRLRSLNWTFAWINEATGVEPEVLTHVISRCGRYPSADFGGVRWGGVLLDFNQPDAGSWLDNYIKNPESNYGIFLQPPAGIKRIDPNGQVTYEPNPEAENLENLGSKEEGDPEDMTPQERGMRYYKNQMSAWLKMGRPDVVDNLFCMLDVPIIDGKPVYTNFKLAKHVADVEIKPEPFAQVIIGMDQSGIHPAAVVMQYQQGKWCVLDELYAEGEGLENFIYGLLIPLLRGKYSTNSVIAAIDPSNQRDSWQAITPKRRLEEAGIVAVTEISNSPKLRIQMVEHMLNQDTGGLLVSPECRMLIRGFTHEYRFRKLRSSGTTGAAYTPQPEKNDVSHIHDALQYAALLIYRGKQEDSTQVKELAQKAQDQRRILSKIL